jgi:Cu+-exporting ATPase
MKKVILFFLIATGFSMASFAQGGTPAAKADTAKTKYTCPMHPEVLSDTPGACPKCGMALVKKKTAAKQYTCGMHPEITCDKPGKCPKCGMALVEKKQ